MELRTDFYSQVRARYPLPPEQQPYELAGSKSVIPQTDPANSHPYYVMNTYLNLRRAEFAAEQSDNDLSNTHDWRMVTDSFTFRSKEALLQKRWAYEAEITKVHERLPREGTALLAAFATSRHWPNRALAAVALPTLIESGTAPEAASLMLKRLEKDVRSSEVRILASRSIGRIGCLNVGKPREQPEWAQPNWPGVTHWATSQSLIAFLRKHHFSERQVIGAARTVTDLFMFQNDTDFAQWAEVAPYPQPWVAKDFRREDFLFDTTTLYGKMTATAMHPRNWVPYAVPLGPAYYDKDIPASVLYDLAIREHLTAIAFYLNERLNLDPPLPLLDFAPGRN